jgi:hypothetical protein
MAHDSNKAADWYFWVKCRKCGEKAVAFRDRSRGRLRQVSGGEYAIICGSCGDAGIYAATDLRSGPAAVLGTRATVA